MRLFTELINNVFLTLLLESFIFEENFPAAVKITDLKGDPPC